MKKYDSIAEMHPDLVQIWETAWQKQLVGEKFIIPLDNRPEAVTLRKRLYSIRKKMLKESFPNSGNYNYMQINLEENQVVIFLPNWVVKVREALKKEGVEPATPEEDKRIETIEERKPSSAEVLATLFPVEQPREERHE